MTTTVKIKKGGFWGFVLRHKGATFFLLLLIITSIWAFLRIRTLENQNQTITQIYVSKIDSIRMTEIQTNARYFSWVMRSEILRKDLEPANLYINKLMTKPNIEKVYVIDTENNSFLLSSDTAEVGQPLMDLSVLQTEEGIQRIDSKTLRAITPIAGLNKQIGVLVIEIDMKKEQ